ncbi:DUF4214 domain-containing protein [Massilia arenae]|uniref:DUF4214 domain-containing protein n=1 Tax=Massilia arenae TaxID=2603288 RepID=A0A5C7FV18_9BURK|nr:DUF4214 domain-containing protein [Massilia arenae]TXF99175.1 DUF4214 domain-containing protein [Massilia arenae]
MTQRILRTTLALAFLALAGCGGQADAPALQTMSGAAESVAPSQLRLGTPLTNDQARAAQGYRPGVVHERQEAARVLAEGTALVIDTRDREQVRLVFNNIYREPTPALAWTGSHAAGIPGTTSPAFKAAVIQRVNWFRAMAGLRATVRLSDAYSAKAQHAALMMSVAGQLSHTPPPSWKFYTQEGAQAANASNLALGIHGPDTVDGYIQDDGDNNAAVGHRRWIFHPNTLVMGTGDVPSGAIDGRQVAASNALWVTDTDYWGPRTPVRDDFVAWPASGYVPYSTVYERWSLSYPNADFSQAKISVTRDGVPVGLAIETIIPDVGENTIVWKMPVIDGTRKHPRPTADVRYRVSVSNVVVAQRARSFDYEVTVFDPAVATPGRALPVASAPTLVRAGQPYTARIDALPGASAYSLTEYLRTPLAATRAAPIDAGTWTTANGGHHAIIDRGALRFYVDGNWEPQSATLNKTLYVASGAAKVLVTRSMGLATKDQAFRVQASSDDGANWRDLYQETGRDVRGPLTGKLSVALDDYSGKIVKLRLVADASGPAYVGADTGWTVSEVGFEGVDELGQGRELRSASGEFTLTPARAGNYLLLPRAELHGLYDTDVGHPALVVVDGAVLTGPRAAYTITRPGGLLTIVDNSGRDGTQTVRDPFRLDFTDVTLAFDVDGNAGQTYRLYRAAFNRTPDTGGIAFWIRSMDGGLTLENMARDFSRSDEFITLYGAAPTHSQIITAIYRNVLKRPPDEAGAAYWLQHLANGMPIERLLVEFSESPENKKQVAAEIALGIAYPRQ